MTNLDAFNLITARVFASCYVEFPLKCDFTPEDFAEEIEVKDPKKLFYYSMQWLKRYGWITIDSSELGPNSSQVQLTEKALVALGWLPEALSHKGEEPLGRRMADAFAQGAAAEAGKLVILALKAGMS